MATPIMHSRVHPLSGHPLLSRPPARLLSALVLGALIFASGCSKGPKNIVSGKVTINGNPVAGSITFVGPDGKEAMAGIAPDGTYSLPNPPLGNCKVAVKGIEGVAAKAPPGSKDAPAGIPKDMSKDMGGVTPATMGTPPPAKYGKPETSGLTFNVTGGKQEYNIPLTP